MTELHRIERIGDATTLYLGDCREILPGLGRVDAVVTDPPYGIGFSYVGGREVAKDPRSYWSWLQPIYRSCLDVLADGGFWAFWQSGTYHRYLWEWFGDDVRIYIAAKNFVQLRPTAINYAYDPVAIGYKLGSKELRPLEPPRSLDFSVGNTAGVVANRDNLEKAHPTPRPVDQVAHLIENFVAENGVVLDPFMGSGTTGVACAKLGRRFVGIEIEERYFDISCRRIEAAYAQPDMFVPRPRQTVEQPSLLEGA